MWHKAQGTLNCIESVWLGKPNGPARVVEAWGGMQIQTSTWESCSACQWIQLALGLPCALSDCACLRGEKTSLLPGLYPGTAHTQEEEAARALGAGGTGELGLKT